MLCGLQVYTTIGRCNLHLSARTSQVYSTEPLHNVSTNRGFALIQFTQELLEKVVKSEVRVRKVSFTFKMYYATPTHNLTLCLVCTPVFLRMLVCMYCVCLVSSNLPLQNYKDLFPFFSLPDNVSIDTTCNHS